MTEEDNEIVKAMQNVGFAEGDVKVQDHCHVTEKYRGAVHRNCNINVSLN